MTTHVPSPGRLGSRAVAIALACVIASWPVRGADNPRQIVEEVQRRTRAASQRYEGTLEVFDAKAKVSTKRWTFERLGSHGESKSVIRFTAPAEVKGVALLIVNHTIDTPSAVTSSRNQFNDLPL